MLENPILSTKESTIVTQSLKATDSKKKKLSSPSFRGKGKEESIPLQANSTMVEESVSFFGKAISSMAFIELFSKLD